ncbi:uncharacterized protein Bfra_003933 [Botrytis fragariae]|uniref:Heterokaryon incompatibility domain-containing protein n=1 Tax=Botrytis fragariae TaxID=1964551 RepID=A0A8H6AXS7_9HELO|nr:uncharacterized protein Bfra_003933 [Botrytis fragariae]KAF5875479.1 hypothetical protein Bfra_003933 [Botrytis fragariae]
MASNRYQYKPLTEHDSIRLLGLSPSVDTTADIHCALLTTTLGKWDNDTFNGYTALSYVWGDPEKKKVIYIGHEVIGITVNLDSALRDIRDPLMKQYLWIDAICIDQANSSEKSKQVIQMAKIYQIARNTIIYLGESTESSTLLLGAISRFCKQKPGHVRSKGLSDFLFNDTAAHTEEHNEKAWKLVLELLERPWFTRVWVFQELLFSVDPWVQCGRHRVSWGHLSQVTKAIAIFFAAFEQPEAYRVFAAMNKERSNFNSIRRPSKTLAENLISFLTVRRGLGASDPRDMVFAHKGIVQASPYQNYLEAEDIAIDYSKSVEKVFADLACHCLKTFPDHSRLEILSYKENHNDWRAKENELEVPSWVPNWTVKGFPHPYRRLREMEHMWGSTVPPILSEVQVHTSPTLYTWMNTSLVCSGWRAGNITKVSSAITLVQAGWKLPKEYLFRLFLGGNSRQKIWIHALTELYRHWCDVLGPLYSDANIMKSNSDDSASSRPQLLIDLFKAQSQSLRMKRIDEIAQTLSPYEILPTMVNGFFQRNWGNASLFASTMSVIIWAHAVIFEHGKAETAFSEVLYDRRFATLEDGTLVLVPVTAMIGDVVCWLSPDLTTPFVLREKAGPPAISENTIKDLGLPLLRDSEPAYSEYAFVGECHIDTSIYSHGQESTRLNITIPRSTITKPRSTNLDTKPRSTQNDYFGQNPGLSNHHKLETFLIS